MPPSRCRQRCVPGRPAALCKAQGQLPAAGSGASVYAASGGSARPVAPSALRDLPTVMAGAAPVAAGEEPRAADARAGSEHPLKRAVTMVRLVKTKSGSLRTPVASAPGDSTPAEGIRAHSPDVGILDLNAELLERILVHLRVDDLLAVQSKQALGVPADAALAVARRLVGEQERPEGCEGSRVPAAAAAAAAQPHHHVMVRLRELEMLDHEPLTFTVAPPAVACAGGAATVVGAVGFATAVCAQAPMRAGVHHADFHIVNASKAARTRLCWVGVVRSDFDAVAGGRATRHTRAWGWSGIGGGSICTRGVPSLIGGFRADWETGDTLGLRLDLDRGRLVGYKNGNRLGCLTDQVSANRDEDEDEGAAFCWFVEMYAVGTAVAIASGAPTSDSIESVAEAADVIAAAERADASSSDDGY